MVNWIVSRGTGVFTAFFLSLFISMSAFASVDVSLPDSSASSGSTVDIPVLVSDLTGEAIYAFGIKLEFDNSVLEAIDVQIAGTLIEPWGSPTVGIQDGSIHIAGAGSIPLVGSGILLIVTFEVKGSAGLGTVIHFKELLFNEGTPSATGQDGHFTVIEASSVQSATDFAPQRFVLSQNYPNPFNGTTLIHYAIPVESNVKLEILSITGRSVAILIQGRQLPGFYAVHWSGNNESGSPVPSGLYFYRVKTDHFDRMKKLTIIK